ncbi:hypothetical protein Tco_0340527 [Tanacetum coccineum]
MTESPLVDSGFVVPVFSPGDDPIACLNKAMAFLTAVASSRFPSTNNQLRTSSNPRNQATIQDGRVTVQQVQGRQGQSYSGTGYKSNATSSRGNNASGQARVVECYNYQGERHMARQCTQPKRPRNAAWYKDKAMLAEAQKSRKILDEEQLAFLADPGVPDGQAVQTIIPNNAAFQTEELDTYDSDYNDVSNAKAVLMANISNYGPDVISEAQQDSMILSVIEQMLEQMINHINNWKKANKEQNSESLTAELERYKERVKTFEQRLNIDLSSHFGKRFTLQPELSAEQALWFRISNSTIESSNKPPVKVELPSELAKVSLVNASLKKLKFHLAQFDSMVKKRTTPDARTEGEWGFKHTKAIFNNEIIPFLKSLKDIFNVFDKDLLNAIIEVQTVFDQMDVAVQQSSVDKQCLEIDKKELLLENDRLLQQIMSQDVLLAVMNSMSLNGESVNMERKRNESCDKYFNLDAELLKSQNAHNDLLKSYSQLEKYCISLELSIQLNQEIFQKHKSCDNQNTLEIPNFVAKLLSENEHLCIEINHVKQVFKDQFDSIKKTCVRTTEHCNSLIDKLNLKCAKNEDLKAQIQDKVFVITSLKNDLRKVKGKEIIDIATQIPSANTIVPGMFKLDVDPLSPKLLQNREAHIDYLMYTQEQADILQGIVEQAKAKQPLDNALDFACKHAKRIQELLCL